MARFGGVTNPRSGAGWSRKNDGRTATELVEFKRTDNQQYITLRYADLELLRRHAVVESRLPVFIFELGGREWVVLAEPDYAELVRGGHQPGSASGLRTSKARVVQPSKVPGPKRQWANQSVLRRSS